MIASKRIERTLDRLCHKKGVSGRLTSEPKIAKIRTKPRVTIIVASLKAFNEDLNTLEVYAHAHNEMDKLYGQLILDTANQLSKVLKLRYLDLHQSTAASTWWCGPRSRLGWVEMAVGLSKGSSYPGYSPSVFR